MPPKAGGSAKSAGKRKVRGPDSSAPDNVHTPVKAASAPSTMDSDAAVSPSKRPKRALSESASSAAEGGGGLSLLRDPVQVAQLLPDTPVSPSAAAHFVRRSGRSRKPTVTVTPEGLQDNVGGPSSSAAPLRSLAASFGLTDHGRIDPVLESTLRSSFPAVGPSRLTLDHHPLKNLCVSATSFIPAGSFVLEYAGDLLTASDAVEAEERYGQLEDVGCYMFFIKFRRKKLCIDGTAPGPGAKPGSVLQQHRQPHHATSSEQCQAATSPPAPLLPAPTDSAVGASGGTSAGAMAAAASSDGVAAASVDVAAASALPSPPPSVVAIRPESIGYGFGRYINHSRAANLSAKVFDVPCERIRTDSFDAAAAAAPARHEPTDEAPSSSSTPLSPTPPSPRSRDECKEAIKPPTYTPSSSSPSSSAAAAAFPIDLRLHYPRLCFFANRPIYADEELTIDYGDRDPGSTADFPWLLT